MTASKKEINTFMSEETLDEIVNGRLRIYQKQRGYRFSLDAILLAHFISLKTKAQVIELGCGSGIISLILAARLPQIKVIGLEIQEELAELAQKNVEINNFSGQIKIMIGDAREIRKIFAARSFDAVIFNPPYRKIASGRINPDGEKSIARHEIKGSVREFLKAASYLLKPKGRAFIIYPATRLASLVRWMRENKIEPKKMKQVFSDSASPAEFVLVEGRVGGREELTIEPVLLVYDKNKEYTGEMKAIFSELASFPSRGGGQFPES